MNENATIGARPYRPIPIVCTIHAYLAPPKGACCILRRIYSTFHPPLVLDYIPIRSRTNWPSHW